MPRFSVVIPTYNRKHLLFDCLSSVCAQTMCDHEIIVVDDGSTDGTIEAISRIPQFAKVRTARHLQNAGTPAALNTGISLARGEYVVILGSDDLLEPCHHEIVAGFVDATPDVAILCCDCLMIDVQGSVIAGGETFQEINGAVKRYPLSTGYRGVWDVFEFSTSCVGMAIRRDVFDAVGWFDPTAWPVEDYEFQLRAAAAGRRVFYLHQPLARYRMHGENITGSSSIWTCQRKVKCLRSALKHYPQLRRFGWRARYRLADAYLELALALRQQKQFKEFLNVLFHAMTTHPGVIREALHLISLKLNKYRIHTAAPAVRVSYRR